MNEKSVESAERDDSPTGLLQLPDCIKFNSEIQITTLLLVSFLSWVFFNRCNQQHFVQNILSFITLIYVSPSSLSGIILTPSTIPIAHAMEQKRAEKVSSRHKVFSYSSSTMESDLWCLVGFLYSTLIYFNYGNDMYNLISFVNMIYTMYTQLFGETPSTKRTQQSTRTSFV